MNLLPHALLKKCVLTLTVEDDFFGVNFGCISLFWFHFSKNLGTTFPLWTNGGKSWRSAKPKDLLKIKIDYGFFYLNLLAKFYNFFSNFEKDTKMRKFNNCTFNFEIFVPLNSISRKCKNAKFWKLKKEKEIFSHREFWLWNGIGETCLWKKYILLYE